MLSSLSPVGFSMNWETRPAQEGELRGEGVEKAKRVASGWVKFAEGRRSSMKLGDWVSRNDSAVPAADMPWPENSFGTVSSETFP